jgi:uncharacterized protein YceK
MARTEGGAQTSSGFLVMKSDTTGMYPATRMDAELIGLGTLTSIGSITTYPALSIWLAGLTVCMVVDLPFSLATDTLLLPYDYYYKDKDE